MKSTPLVILLAGLVLLGACKSKNYEAINDSRADTVSAAADTLAQPKLVKTADIRFKVKNVQQTSDSVTTLTVKYNGMVMHHEMNAYVQQTNDVHLSNDSIMRVSAINTTAEMSVRIPSQKIEAFLTTISHMSMHVNAQRMDISDKSLDYLASQLKLDSRRELVSQQKKGKVVIKDPGAVLNLKDDLVDEQISNRRINDEVKYSTISLSFYQSNTISKEVVANDDASSYHPPFYSQLSMAFDNGWYLFKQLIIVLMDMWAFILVGAAVWIGVRVYRRRAQLL